MYGLRRARYGPWTPLLPLLCASAAITTIECVIPSDLERYWMLSAGRWMLAHGRVLESLHGSWYPSRPWVDQEWLVALATAWTQAHGIYLLLQLLFAASLVAGLLFVTFECIRTRAHPLIACAQLAVTAIGAVDFAQDRAQTLVWALLPAIVLAWRARPWLAVPILALWANVHGSFPIAVLWMLLHLDRRRIAPFLVATLATLANPLGWHLWAFTLELARNGKLHGYVSEWMPALSTRAGVLAALLALAPLWIRCLSGIRLRKPPRYGDLLWIAATAAGTVLAVRYAMLLFLTTATTLGDSLRTRARPMPFVTRAASVVFTCILVALSARFFFSQPVLAEPLFDSLARGASFSACAPLVRGRRVFTDALEIGSLVEVAGGSANLDGRIDAFPQSKIRDAALVLNHPKDARPVVERSGAQMLALLGTFAPPQRRWRFLRSCGPIRLYARKR